MDGGKIGMESLQFYIQYSVNLHVYLSGKPTASIMRTLHNSSTKSYIFTPVSRKTQHLYGFRRFANA